MRYFKKFGLVSAVLLVVASVLTTAASAQGLPTILPETAEKGWSTFSTGGVLTFSTLSGKVFECLSASGEATETTAGKSLGPMHIRIIDCLSEESKIKIKCTGLGDATAGEVLVLGEWHLVYDTGGTELGAALLLLFNSTHFTCGGIFLIKLEGELVCLMLEPYVLKELHEFHCKGNGLGDQTETYLNDKGTETGGTITPVLKSTTNEGTSETCDFRFLGLILWLEKNKTKDILIMMT